MHREELCQVTWNDSLDKFSLIDGTHYKDDMMMLNDFQVPQNHSYTSHNHNLYFNPHKFSFPVSPDHVTAQKFIISSNDISHPELNNIPTMVASKKSNQYTYWTQEEERSSLIRLNGYDQDASPYYPITEVQSEEESYNSLDQVIHQNLNDNLYFNSYDFLKDLEQSQNELPFRTSVDHFAAEDTADTTMDITHTELNDVPATLVLSTKPRKCKHWTEIEQSLFLIGLRRYGWGKWKEISDEFVVTRTKTQVASHAQKYLQRVKAPKEKKIRKSIHDMTLQQDKDVRAAPNFDQQTWVLTPNQQVQQLQNQFLTPNLATQQLQEVQQLPYNVPYQMNGFGYLGDIVNPHNIQLHNWVSCPIQPYAMKAQGLSQSTTQIATSSRMEDLWMLQG